MRLISNNTEEMIKLTVLFWFTFKEMDLRDSRQAFFCFGNISYHCYDSSTHHYKILCFFVHSRNKMLEQTHWVMSHTVYSDSYMMMTIKPCWEREQGLVRRNDCRGKHLQQLPACCAFMAITEAEVHEHTSTFAAAWAWGFYTNLWSSCSLSDAVIKAKGQHTAF